MQNLEKENKTQTKNISKWITIDLSNASSNTQVLRECVQELRWKECESSESVGCDIYWHSKTCPIGYYKTLKQGGSVNKFPSMSQLLKKASLTRALNVMRMIYPKEYDFYPRTWFLPEQFDEFKTDCEYMHCREEQLKVEKTTFIVKPNGGSQGYGIYLIRNPDDFIKMTAKSKKTTHFIVQEYLNKPFLIDHLKSDLRIYVLVSSLMPLEVYICDEGLVRFATMDYQLPNDQNLSQVFMHLTNYSLNKKNKSYKFVGDLITENTESSDASFPQEIPLNKGSKRKLTQVLAEMRERGHDVDKLMSDIDDLVIKTMFALLSEMKVEYLNEMPLGDVLNPGPKCFQIIGFDILLSEKLKPMLLEVNCNPSLRIDYEAENGLVLPSPIDRDIKRPLIMETLLLKAPKKKQEKMDKKQNEDQEDKELEKHRDLVARQKIQDISKRLMKPVRLDLNKSPLLSKAAKDCDFKRKPKTKSMDKDLISILTSSSYFFYHNSLTLTTSQVEIMTKPQKKFKKCLRKIFPLRNTQKSYAYLNIIENVSNIFHYLCSNSQSKLLNQEAFYHFIKNCHLVTDTITSDNLGIFYNESVKKWSIQMKKNLSPLSMGLCFQGFVELFITLSKLNFPAKDLRASICAFAFYTLNLLRLDGMIDTKYCVTSENGPIYKASENVFSKLRHVYELKRQNALTESPYYNNNLITRQKLNKKPKSFSSFELLPLADSTQQNQHNFSKQPKVKSFFPIYF